MTIKEIDFKKSMSCDERDTRFAQLRSKWLDKKGLFPVVDMETLTTSNGYHPQKFIQGDGLWIIGEDDDYDIMFSEVTTGNSFGITTGVESRDTAEDLGDALFYHDGVENCIYGIEEGSGDVFKFVTGTKVFTANVDTSFASGGEYLMGYNTSTDNLYYISGYNLYKQDGTTFSASLKTLPQGHEYKKMIEYKGFMAIFAEVEATGETRMFLYDVINEPATFEKTISLGYGFFIGAAVLNEAITVIVQNIKSKNSKENEGFTWIKQFNGSYFNVLNRLKNIDDAWGSAEARWNTYTDGINLYLGLGEEVAYNGIYQINHLGEVSVVGVTGDMEMGDGKFYTVNEYHGILVAGYRDKDNNYKLAQLHDGYSDYSDFTVDSEYITSYFGDTSVTKELRSFTLSFTKTNLTDFGEEEANVYYRTIDPSNIDSHDDEVASWSKILTYDIDVDGEDDRKVQRFTSGQSLPEYKEIQFKITSKRGLNITSAKFEYEVKEDD